MLSKLDTLISETRDRVDHEGVWGLRWPIWMAYDTIFVKTISEERFGYRGENVFKRDWDVLILLDACRVDLVESVTHPLLNSASVDTTWSIAPHSNSFLVRTFTSEFEDILKETGYVTANPHTEEKLNPNPGFLLEVDEVWKYAWDDDIGTVPARPVTDRAISMWRDTQPEKLIVHYMQPHFPSIPHRKMGSEIKLGYNTGWPDSVWERLRQGKISKEKVWEAYQDNLLYVLDDVELLLSSIEADSVVISSDHGNAMGERGFYGHSDRPTPEIWRVPWIRTTAVTQSEYEPTTEKSSKPRNKSDIRNKLEALGYKT